MARDELEEKNRKKFWFSDDVPHLVDIARKFRNYPNMVKEVCRALAIDVCTAYNRWASSRC